MKKVVIIGGGFAGTSVAKEIEKKKDFEVVLIDNKEYFEFTPGILRTLVEPEHARDIQKLHKHYLKKSKFILGEVLDISDKQVKVGGKNIDYDYLVITSGSSYGSPIKDWHAVLADRADKLISSSKRLEKSKGVSIIGGGLAGVELAAEIICKYPDKNISLYHSRHRLCDKHKMKTSEYIHSFLSKRGVKIHLDKLDKVEEGDLVFSCTGIKPSFSFLNKDYLDIINDEGFILVNNYLQTYKHPNIFSAGDVADTLGIKMAQNAIIQGKIVAKNIIALENGKKMKEYLPSKNPVIVSLGKYNGVFEYGEFVWTGLIPGFMKRVVEWMEMRKF